jgi:hypothetical protein
MIICCRFVVTHAEDLLNTNLNIEGVAGLTGCGIL